MELAGLRAMHPACQKRRLAVGPRRLLFVLARLCQTTVAGAQHVGSLSLLTCGLAHTQGPGDRVSVRVAGRRLSAGAAVLARSEEEGSISLVTAGSVAQRLDALPSPDDPWFPPRLNDYIFHVSNIRTVLDTIVKDTTKPLEVRFKAFYGYLNHARRSLDISEYDGYYDSHQGSFGSFAILPLLHSQRYLNHIQAGEYNDSLALMAQHFASIALQQLPNHFGVNAHWATVIAAVQSKLPREERDQALIRRAITAQDVALVDSQNRYPRYFATKAQLLELAEDWDGALAAIGRAIDLEDSSMADYAVRVGQYEAMRSEIQAERRFQNFLARGNDELSTLRTEFSRVSTELAEMRNSTLTLVGLLAAIVAFITTSTTLLTRLSVHDAIRFTAISSAGILFVFTSILWLVTSPKSRPEMTRFLFIIAVAVFLAILALLT